MSRDMPPEPVVVRREDLYRQVWETPMYRLAARYGLSGRGLSKICERLDIPVPPRGYWARKAAGKRVVQYQLPEPETDTPLEVTISPTLPPPAPPKVPAEVKDGLERLREEIGRISVPKQLPPRPHAIIAEWIAEDTRPYWEPWPVSGASGAPRRRRLSPIERRQYRFLHALFKALERQGVAIQSDGFWQTHLEVQGERVEYSFREKYRFPRRPLTEEEKRSPFNKDKEWVRERQATGQLVFEIKTRLAEGVRHTWTDTASHPLEEHLTDIVATVIFSGPILVQRRQEREEAVKRRREGEHQRYLERERQRLERNRGRRLMEMARRWEELKTVRAFLAALEELPQPDDRAGLAFLDRSISEKAIGILCAYAQGDNDEKTPT